jgi:hypothetical protein
MDDAQREAHAALLSASLEELDPFDRSLEAKYWRWRALDELHALRGLPGEHEDGHEHTPVVFDEDTGEPVTGPDFWDQP